MSNIELTELPNGIRIISEKEKYFETISLGIWIDVGSRNEPKKLFFKVRSCSK